MADTFLSQAAACIAEAHPETYAGVRVILPSQRACLYFKKALAALHTQTVLAPQVQSIEDFVLSETKAKLLEPHLLLLECYLVFKQIEPELDLDKFVTWGDALLKDFDAIDLYLVDAASLFSYLNEAESLKRWAAQLGLDHLDPSPNAQAYFEWNAQLLQVYQGLNQRLKEQGQAYRGMAFRQLAEQVSQNGGLKNPKESLYFIGFNALSKSEEVFMQTLVKSGQAQTLWDVDRYYFDAPEHKAGQWLREYANPLSSQYLSQAPFRWVGNRLLEEPKRMQVLAASTRSAQVRLALDLIAQWEQAQGPEEQVALVLCDESLLDLLLPYLHPYKERLNITMGYSLRRTWIYEWCMAWWDLILDHSPLEKPQLLWNAIEGNPFWRKGWCQGLGHLFEKKERTYLQALHDLDQICMHLMHQTPAEEWDEQSEALWKCAYLLKDLQIQLENYPALGLKSGRALFMQCLGQQSLSFEGAEKRSLHVMGLLETRTLDFDRVILLSVNEGMMPSAGSRNSLIPADIASMKEFELPTFTQADAVSSYHFHRLLQRAKEVVFTYVLPSPNNQGKEESRFIKQLRLDLKSQNPHLDWKEAHLVPGGQVQALGPEMDSIPKSPAVLAAIRERLKTKGLSASALIRLAKCPMQYYLDQILGIKEPKALEQDMGTDVFGSWLHKVLELDPYLKEDLDASLDRALDQLRKESRWPKDAYRTDVGFNLILKSVAITLLEKYKSAAKDWSAQSPQVLAMEWKVRLSLSFPLPSGPVEVLFVGQMDRVEWDGQQLSILDFKTGKVDAKDLDWQKEGSLSAALLASSPKEKLMQLWVYRYLWLCLLEENQKNPDFHTALQAGYDLAQAQFGMISFRNLEAGPLFADLNFIPGENLLDFKKASEGIIQQLLSPLLDPDQAIVKTTDLDHCKYCSFAYACGRSSGS